MSHIAEQILAEMLEAAKGQGINLARFLLGKRTSRFIKPWWFFGYHQLGIALFEGGYLAWVGNTDVFVLDCVRGLVFGFDSDGSPSLIE